MFKSQTLAQRSLKHKIIRLILEKFLIMTVINSARKINFLGSWSSEIHEIGVNLSPVSVLKEFDEVLIQLRTMAYFPKSLCIP